MSGSGSKISGIILAYATSIVGPEKAEEITSQVLESETTKTHLDDVTVSHSKGSCRVQ